jgi:predicted RNase H-like HicB family nuclease
MSEGSRCFDEMEALTKQRFSERYRIFALQNEWQNIILNQKTKISRLAMEYTVLIQPQRGGFMATIPILPECRAKGKTEQEALDKVRACAQEVLTKSKFVTIEARKTILPYCRSFSMSFGSLVSTKILAMMKLLSPYW